MTINGETMENGAMTPEKKNRVPTTALARGAKLAARREHTRAELGRKLRGKGHAPDEVSAALDRLEEKGFVRDGRAARALVSARAARGDGPKKIVVALRKRGIPAREAEQLLRELDPPEAERARAAALAARWLALAPPGKVALKLQRRGFTAAAVAAAVAGAEFAGAEGPDDGADGGEEGD